MSTTTTARGFARHMAVVARTAPSKVRHGALAALHDLHREAHDTFGDLDRLRDLRPATQEKRVALGFTPNDPLLMTGGERDSLGMSWEVAPGLFRGNVGTDDERAFWQELGTIRMAPLPFLSVASYIASVRFEVIVRLLAEALLEGERGAGAMAALLVLEASRDQAADVTGGGA